MPSMPYPLDFSLVLVCETRGKAKRRRIKKMTIERKRKEEKEKNEKEYKHDLLIFFY
jgi:hypothetical protein